MKLKKKKSQFGYKKKECGGGRESYLWGRVGGVFFPH